MGGLIFFLYIKKGNKRSYARLNFAFPRFGSINKLANQDEPAKNALLLILDMFSTCLFRSVPFLYFFVSNRLEFFSRFGFVAFYLFPKRMHSEGLRRRRMPGKREPQEVPASPKPKENLPQESWDPLNIKQLWEKACLGSLFLLILISISKL